MFSGPDPVLWIDGDAVAGNLSLVRGRIGPTGLIAVLEDNAYGHGMLPMGRVLAAAGVDRFGVGCVEEALALQAGGVSGRILNLRLFAEGEARRIVTRGIAQAVFTEAHVRVLAEAARAAGRRAFVHVKVDTGLGRFGVPEAEAAAFVERVRRNRDLLLSGVFSMLAEDPERDVDQIRRFLDLRHAVGADETWHLVSSHGVLHHPESRLDAVRPGCLLMGFPPSPEVVAGLRPTARLEASVLGTRTFAAGDRVGFGAGWRIDRPTTVAHIGAGLRHGLRASLARGADVLIGGRRHPIRLVAGEHLVAEMTGPRLPSRGETAVLLGRDGREEIDLEEWARGMGTSRYTALSALSSRVRRELRGIPCAAPSYDATGQAGRQK